MGLAPHSLTMKVVLALSLLLALASAAPKTDNALLCAICIDLVTELDNFITSDTTEQEIVTFVEQICAYIGTILPQFEATCDALVETQRPAIIEGLVHDNLNPQEVCVK